MTSSNTRHNASGAPVGAVPPCRPSVVPAPTRDDRRVVASRASSFSVYPTDDTSSSHPQRRAGTEARPLQSSSNTTRKKSRWTRAHGRTLTRALCTVIAFCLLISPALAQKKKPKKKPKQKPKAGAAEFRFPKLEDLKLPTVEELLDREASPNGDDKVDWIIIKGPPEIEKCFVYRVKPISPRPRTIEKIEARIKAAEKWPEPKTAAERLDQLAKKRELPWIELIMIDLPADEQGQKVHYLAIREIRHHEDLLLLRIEKLQEEGKLALAYELLFNMQRQKPNWPRLDIVQQKQLFVEAADFFKKNQTSAALVRLEELHSRAPNFDGLSGMMGRVVDRLTTAAIKDNDYRKARHYIGRLYRRDSNNAVYKKWEGILGGKADEQLRLARQATAAKKYDEAAIRVARAAYYWPRANGLSGAFETMQRRWQRVTVGVEHFPLTKKQFPLPTMADARRRSLTTTPLFEPGGVDDIVHYGTRFFQEWLPTDLGRKSLLTMHAKRATWQAAPETSSLIVADNLRERLNSKSPHYDERLKSYIKAIRVVSPTQLEIQFERVPPRLESVLRFPLLKLDSLQPSATAVTSTGQPLKRGDILSSRFRPFQTNDWTPTRQVFRRNIAEPDGVTDSRYHVAEVIERKFTKPELAIQALKRGQIDMIAHIRPYHQKFLAADNRLDVRKYAAPITHVLQFNPDSILMRNREIRRVLAYALDRRSMLDRFVLRTHEAQFPDELKRLGRVVSAPYASDSYAYDPDVKPKPYDIKLALALLLTIKRQHQRAHAGAVGGSMMLKLMKKGEKTGWLPPIRMLVEPGEDSKAVAEMCVKQWGRIKLKIEIVDASKLDPKKSGQWDFAYRKVRMLDPMVDLWPFLTFDNRARVESLKHLPDWLRQELVRLDTARDWPSAVEMVRKLHDLMQKETQTIPLFEVDDYMALRREVKAFRSVNLEPAQTYQNIERWRLVPRFPEAFPK